MQIPAPEHQRTIVHLIDEHHEKKNSLHRPRPYMGISSLGHSCDRWLWLQFRWAVIPTFPGRVLRIFRRGHNEEDVVVADLMAVGLDIHETGDSQHTVHGGCHVEGHMDGVIRSGVPEAPKKPHILEIKTHNAKSFKELLASGVMESKFEHYVQMQIYMLLSQIDRALYVAVCKDDDQMYTERVRLEPLIAKKYLERGHRLALVDHLPPPLSSFECEWCSAYSFCHQIRKTNQVNCRTCAHSTPKADGTWFCERWAEPVPTSDQYLSHRCHCFHPDLVPWQLDLEHTTEWTAAWVMDGTTVLNGEDGYSSEQILAGGPFIDAVVEKARRMFNGRIVHAKK